jgi:pyruvate kinase
MLDRRTKILATLGPSTDPPEVLDRLVAAGLDCARLNCSHGTHDELRRRAADVRAASERAGRAIGLLFDLQGPKLRLAADTETQTVRPGDTMVFCEAGCSGGPGRAVVEFEDFTRLVTDRSEIVIGDGVPRFAVRSIDGPEVVAEAVSPGPVAPARAST